MYQPNEREQAAESRHAQIEPSLRAAFNKFESWLHGFDGLSVEAALELSEGREREHGHAQSVEGRREKTTDTSLEEPSGFLKDIIVHNTSHCILTTNVSSDAVQHQAEPQKNGELTLQMSIENCCKDQSPDLDLLALLELQSLVKPKFSFYGDAVKPCNLFNCLISNTEPDERIAAAHESQVIVPGSCSFFISDMSKFRMLLKGKCTYSCWSPPNQVLA